MKQVQQLRQEVRKEKYFLHTLQTPQDCIPTAYHRGLINTYTETHLHIHGVWNLCINATDQKKSRGTYLRNLLKPRHAVLP